jgi:hypothetical protein
LDAQAPDSLALDVRSSDAQAPDAQALDVQSSDAQASDAQAPDVQASDVQSSSNYELQCHSGYELVSERKASKSMFFNVN